MRQDKERLGKKDLSVLILRRQCMNIEETGEQNGEAVIMHHLSSGNDERLG